MPAMIRAGGKMYGADGKLKDTKAVNPESTFSRIYQEIINFCKTEGQFDPRTMGTVPNVGLMAQKAEEYGSTTRRSRFPRTGGQHRGHRHRRSAADPERRSRRHLAHAHCQGRADPRLGQAWPSPGPQVRNAGGVLAGLGTAARERAAQEGRAVPSRTMTPKVWTFRSCRRCAPCGTRSSRVSRGQDTIAATGNILRDYLTDLFPILELGTSAKMLSIVPLMAGGCMYETGAGGSAPKHVSQLLEENHLRWDSLGEFLALAVSLEDLGVKTGNRKAQILASTLDAATGKLLDNSKNPRARPVSSTTVAASSTSRCTGRKNSRRRTRTRNWRSTSLHLPRSWPPRRTSSWPNSTRHRAIRWTSAAITTRTEMITAVMRPSKSFNAALAAAAED